MAKLFESMKEATGVDLSEIRESRYIRCKSKPATFRSPARKGSKVSEAEAGKAAADAESPEKAEASEPVQRRDGSEQ